MAKAPSVVAKDRSDVCMYGWKLMDAVRTLFSMPHTTAREGGVRKEMMATVGVEGINETVGKRRLLSAPPPGVGVWVTRCMEGVLYTPLSIADGSLSEGIVVGCKHRTFNTMELTVGVGEAVGVRDSEGEAVCVTEALWEVDLDAVGSSVLVVVLVGDEVDDHVKLCV